MRYIVIMAGGSGTRFWPKSRIAKPKQFLNLIGDETMLQATARRVRGLVPPENTIIVTNDSYTGLVKEQLPDIPEENIIGEPVAKNTAPCIGAAAAIIKDRDPDSSMMVLPSDHYIRDEEKYQGILETALQKAEKDSCLLTIGIKPHRPETGYGYIQTDEESSEIVAGNPVCLVKTFAEKPDLPTAVTFLESGDFYWNSGIFIWSTNAILDAFKTHMPLTYREIEKFRKSYPKDSDKALNTFFHAVSSISIDYGIMEKADAVHVIPAEFGWNDVGSWMAIYELAEKGEHGNVTEASKPVLFENSQNCYVSSRGEKMIAVIGMQGVGVVETDDSIMICRLDSAQQVKQLVDKIDERGLGEYK